MADDEIRRLLEAIAATYAEAAKAETVDDMRVTLIPARAMQYDVDYRIHQAWTHQRRGHGASANGR